MKLLSNNGSLINKKVDHINRAVFLSKWGILKAMYWLINDELHNLFESPYFDQNVEVIRTGSN